MGFHKFYNKRSLKQNAYYWGFMMPHMVNFYKECYGEPISRDEIHAYNTKQILGEDFMVKEVFSVPIITKTSKKPSKLNTKDFGSKFDMYAINGWCDFELNIKNFYHCH